MLLSLTVLCSILDIKAKNERHEKEWFAIITASISMALSFLAVAGHLIVPVRKILVGTMLEMTLSIVPLSLWVVGTIMIQNPESWFASKVEEDTGFEEIQYANVFFFSWACLFSNVYLVVAVFVNSTLYNPDLIVWALLLSVSSTLCGISATLKTDICIRDEFMTCRRTKLAIAIGGAGAGLSGIGLILCGLDKMLPTVHMFIGFMCMVMYICGVAFITSSAGPAVTMSSMYFATWGGALFSTRAFARGIAEMFGSSLVQGER